MNNQNIYNQNDNNDITNLNVKLISAYETIEQQKKRINELENNLLNANNKLNNYENIINQKNIELNKLKLQLNNSNLNVQNNYNINDMVSVNFMTADQNVNFSLVCNKHDTFAVVEEKLYQKFPQYRETNNYFLANGKIVLRFKTIDENKIGTGFPVMLHMAQQ